MKREQMLSVLKTLQRVHKEYRLESDGDLGCLVRESICDLLEAIKDMRLADGKSTVQQENT
jgi:hypothetical protein